MDLQSWFHTAIGRCETRASRSKICLKSVFEEKRRSTSRLLACSGAKPDGRAPVSHAEVENAHEHPRRARSSIGTHRWAPNSVRTYKERQRAYPGDPTASSESEEAERMQEKYSHGFHVQSDAQVVFGLQPLPPHMRP